jgi:hypothetical protein
VQRLNQYLEEERITRINLIANLNRNMKNIQRQLEQTQNFTRFFWTPDYHVYGFASKEQIQETLG